MSLKGIRFIEGNGKYKYTAVLTDGKKVSFGHRDYQQYKDSVPVSLGGGLWSHLDHGDPVRRDSYRKRHSALVCKNGEQCISIKYTPAWFSYYYLW